MDVVIKKGWPGQRLEHTNLLRNRHIIITQYLLLIKVITESLLVSFSS